MELIKGYLKTIKVPVPATSTALSASIKDTDGAVVIPSVSLEHENGLVSITLPYSAVNKERNLVLTVTFELDGSQEKRVFLNVATPYLELHELYSILEDEDEEAAWEVEAAVRHVINAHTGQEFGLTEEPQTISGNGATLATTRPVLELKTLTEDGGEVFNSSTDLGKFDYRIAGDGWYIKRPTWSEHTVRNDRSHYYSANPIKAPTFVNSEFRSNSVYVANGRFGYEEVPHAVREAAKLLVNDYACADSLYRDRYLKSMRSADWKIDFASGAWIATGNARADLLLNPYIVNRLVII